MVPDVGAESGGEMLVVGQYIGTSDQVAMGNVTIFIGADYQCNITEVVAEDQILRCTYPPGQGVRLGVVVEVKDSNIPRKDWKSNSMLFTYAEPTVQMLVTARIQLHAQPERVCRVGGAVQSALSKALARFDVNVGQTYVVGTDAQSGRSTDGPLWEFDIAIEASQESAASAVKVAMDPLTGIFIQVIDQSSTLSKRMIAFSSTLCHQETRRTALIWLQLSGESLRNAAACLTQNEEC